MRWLWLSSLLCFAFTLQEAEELALQQNPEIRAAEEMLLRARQNKWESISKYLPKISLLSQAFRTQKPLSFLLLDKPSAFFTQFSLTQSIFSSDAYRDIRIASLGIKQFDNLLSAAKSDILLQVRQLYFLVALGYKKLATAKEHVCLLQHLADRMEGKYRIGEATLYNVNQAKVAVSNVTNRYYDVQQNLKTDKDALIRHLGFDPATYDKEIPAEELSLLNVPEIASKVAQSEGVFSQEGPLILSTEFEALEREIAKKLFPQEEFARWEMIADASRPEIKLAKTYLSMAHQQVKKNYGAYLPTLDLLGNYGGASTPYLELPTTRFNNQVFQWGVGLSLNWNLFDGMGRERRIWKSKNEASAVAFELENTTHAVHTDVRDQLYKMEKALIKYLTASANLKLAIETLAQAESQLEIGYITIYDYMVSVDGLIRAQTTRTPAKSHKNLNWSTMLAA